MAATFRSPTARYTLAVTLVAFLAACGGGDQAETEQPPTMTARPASAPLVERLAAGDAIFGIFSGDHTAEQGMVMGQNRGLDFVFYSLEQGPFDIPTMETYMDGVADGSGEQPEHPLALRIPPVGDDPQAAANRAAEGLEAGVSAIVFPHVQTATHAQTAVDVMGPDLWPGNPDGTLVNMLIVEDQAGIENVDAIVSTPGVSVVFAGPGDLSRAYEGDMEAVENAIQTVLAACQTHDVPCGITAGVFDIAERLEQGFRVIIVTEAEAVPVGRAAAGRN